MRGIADTGFLVALASQRDCHHRWAREAAARLVEPPLTCEAVLAETAFHLSSAEYVLRLVGEEVVRVAFQTAIEWPSLRELARRYADRRPDLADLCLIRMSELHPRHTVITTDRQDFSVYRRNGREAIPLLLPPRA